MAIRAALVRFADTEPEELGTILVDILTVGGRSSERWGQFVMIRIGRFFLAKIIIFASQSGWGVRFRKKSLHFL
jgi:hypothetical protein